MPAPDPFERALTLTFGDTLVDEGAGRSCQIKKLIGLGGMGEVYEARWLDSGGPCAVKIIRLVDAGNPRAVERNRLEAATLRKIVHPNVVGIHATGVRPKDNAVWMAMDLLVGQSLDKLVHRVGKFPLAWAVEIVRDACLGVAAIHRHVVHRDIKPSNIHFGRDAIVHVLDLGAAKHQEQSLLLTSHGFRMGTFAYMPPEHLLARTVDERGDVWQLGVVLFELLAGIHPFAMDGFDGGKQFLIGSRILNERHPDVRGFAPTTSEAAVQILDKALAKDPAHRYRSADELATALTGLLGRLTAEATYPIAPLQTLAEVLTLNVETFQRQSPPQAQGPESQVPRDSNVYTRGTEAILRALATVPPGAPSTDDGDRQAIVPGLTFQFDGPALVAVAKTRAAGPLHATAPHTMRSQLRPTVGDAALSHSSSPRVTEPGLVIQRPVLPSTVDDPQIHRIAAQILAKQKQPPAAGRRIERAIVVAACGLAAVVVLVLVIVRLMR